MRFFVSRRKEMHHSFTSLDGRASHLRAHKSICSLKCHFISSTHREAAWETRKFLLGSFLRILLPKYSARSYRAHDQSSFYSMGCTHLQNQWSRHSISHFSVIKFYVPLISQMTLFFQKCQKKIPSIIFLLLSLLLKLKNRLKYSFRTTAELNLLK